MVPTKLTLKTSKNGKLQTKKITDSSQSFMFFRNCLFIQNSLKDLINTGKGQPNPKDGTNEINAENIKKWQIAN